MPSNQKPAHPLLTRLESKGPKRILALDGGGIRGALTLGYLEKMESILRERHGNPNLLLCDYFDLIGGTSTGAIIAAALSIGKTAREIKDMYLNLGGKIFGKLRKPWLPKKSKFRALLTANYDHTPLEEELGRIFGDITLGDERVKTGLCIVAKRADTFSTWPLHNHPKGQFYGYNAPILLKDALRASSAAPSFFAPQPINVGGQEVGVFVDGGVSLANNPAFQLLLVATLDGFRFNWSVGEDKMLITSVGTGTYRKKADGKEIMTMPMVGWAEKLAEVFMEDAFYFNQILLQILSNSPTAIPINLEVGDLRKDHFLGKKILSYYRYNVRMENMTDKEKKEKAEKGSKFYKLDEYGFHFSESELASLREMDNADNRRLLADIGTAASVEVLPEHFPPAFDLGKRPDNIINFKTFEKPALPFVKAVKKAIPIEVCKIEQPFEVESMEGIVQGKPGDYLMRGVQGELYVCSKEIFEKTYDVVG
jgi:patatin-like phospholipase/acyl hydrolase